jgi:hypothetical protein
MRGGGTPEEVGQFVDWLRECGCWQWVAFALLHHFNRAPFRDVLLRLSGAWDRDADTIIGLAREEGRQQTKLTWAKVRWALDGGPEDAHELLAWDVPTLGFRRVDRPAHRESEALEVVRERVLAFLRERSDWPSTSSVRDQVEGRNDAIDAALRDLFERGDVVLRVARATGPIYGVRGDCLPVAPEQWDDWGRLRVARYWRPSSHAASESPGLFGATAGDCGSSPIGEGQSPSRPTPLREGRTGGDCPPGPDEGEETRS